MSGLPNIGQVLGVHEEPRPPDTPLGHEAKEQVRATAKTIGRVLQLLPTGVEELDSELGAILEVEQPVDARRVSRVERYLTTYA